MHHHRQCAHEVDVKYVYQAGTWIRGHMTDCDHMLVYISIKRSLVYLVYYRRGDVIVWLLLAFNLLLSNTIVMVSSSRITHVSNTNCPGE